MVTSLMDTEKPPRRQSEGQEWVKIAFDHTPSEPD